MEIQQVVPQYLGVIGFVITQAIQPLSYHFLVGHLISTPQQSSLFDITSYQYNIYKFHHWTLWFDIFYLIQGINCYLIFKSFGQYKYKAILYQASWYCRYLIQYILLIVLLSFLPNNEYHFSISGFLLLQSCQQPYFDVYDLIAVQSQLFQGFTCLYGCILLEKYFNVRKMIIFVLSTILFVRFVYILNMLIQGSFSQFQQESVMGQVFQQQFPLFWGFFYSYSLDTGLIKKRKFSKKYSPDLIITLIFSVLYVYCQFITRFELHELQIKSNILIILSYTFARPFLPIFYSFIIYFLDDAPIMKILINNKLFQLIQKEFDFIGSSFILFSKVTLAYIQNVEFGPFDDLIVMFIKNGAIVFTIIIGMLISKLANPTLHRINCYLKDIEKNIQKKQAFTPYNRSIEKYSE